MIQYVKADQLRELSKLPEYAGLKFNEIEARVLLNEQMKDEPQMLRYLAYLQSKHWAVLRWRKLREVGETCQRCGDPSTLDAHHLHYRNLYDVTTNDLIMLCRSCHKSFHQKT